MRVLLLATHTERKSGIVDPEDLVVDVILPRRRSHELKHLREEKRRVTRNGNLPRHEDEHGVGLHRHLHVFLQVGNIVLHCAKALQWK